MHLKRSVFDRHAEIRLQNEGKDVVCRMSRKRIHGGPRNYQIEIARGMDPLICVAICVCMDSQLSFLGLFWP